MDLVGVAPTTWIVECLRHEGAEYPRCDESGKKLLN